MNYIQQNLFGIAIADIGRCWTCIRECKSKKQAEGCPNWDDGREYDEPEEA
jgi:hypothetical protein